MGVSVHRSIWCASPCWDNSLSTPLWEFQPGSQHHVEDPNSAPSFYSLMGVSKHLATYRTKPLGEPLPLSTPLWEFHKSAVNELLGDTAAIHLSTPLWEFRVVERKEVKPPTPVATFYSLMGVSLPQTFLTRCVPDIYLSTPLWEFPSNVPSTPQAPWTT